MEQRSCRFYTHAHTNIHMRAQVYTQRHIHTLTYTHTQTHTDKHTYIYAWTYIHIQVHICTHMCICITTLCVQTLFIAAVSFIVLCFLGNVQWGHGTLWWISLFSWHVLSPSALLPLLQVMCNCYRGHFTSRRYFMRFPGSCIQEQRIGTFV